MRVDGDGEEYTVSCIASYMYWSDVYDNVSQQERGNTCIKSTSIQPVSLQDQLQVHYYFLNFHINDIDTGIWPISRLQKNLLTILKSMQMYKLLCI